MKRSGPPERRTPLGSDPEKRLAFLDRGRRALPASTARLTRGKPPKRRFRWAGAREGESQSAAKSFRRRVFQLYGRRCRVTDSRAQAAHHVVGKQTLRHDGVSELVWDPVNGCPVTHAAHEAHENASRRIRRSELPPQAVEWAERHGYGWYLDRIYD